MRNPLDLPAHMQEQYRAPGPLLALGLERARYERAKLGQLISRADEHSLDIGHRHENACGANR